MFIMIYISLHISAYMYGTYIGTEDSSYVTVTHPACLMHSSSCVCSHSFPTNDAATNALARDMQ